VGYALEQVRKHARGEPVANLIDRHKGY
jgi:hypothetical protein